MEKGDPFGGVCFSGQQHNLLQRRIIFQAVMIKKVVAVPIGTQEFKLLFFCPNTRFLKKLPNDGAQAVLSRFYSAAGVFPSACKTFPLGPTGQQQPAVTVMNPNADHEPKLPGFPWRTTSVDTAGQFSVFVINIVPFHQITRFSIW